jgi:hypothetical protein
MDATPKHFSPTRNFGKALGLWALSLACMLAGSTVVHKIMRPLDKIEAEVKASKETVDK